MRSPPYIYCYLGTLVQKNRKPCKDGNFARTRIRTAAFRLRYNTTDHGVLPSFFFGASREKFKKSIDIRFVTAGKSEGWFASARIRRQPYLDWPDVAGRLPGRRP